MGAKLKELLSIEEGIEIERHRSPFGLVNKEFQNLTVKDLSNISVVIISSANKGRVKNCVLPAEALRILTERAFERNINDLYDYK